MPPWPGIAAAPTAEAGRGWEAPAGGWAIAACLLLAVRQGRLAAEEDRLDVRELQLRQQDSRVQVRKGPGLGGPACGCAPRAGLRCM